MTRRPDPLGILIEVGRAMKAAEDRKRAEQARNEVERKRIRQAADDAAKRAERTGWTELGGGWYAVPMASARRSPRGRVTVERELLEGPETNANGESVVLELHSWATADQRDRLERGIMSLEREGMIRMVRWELRA